MNIYKINNIGELIKDNAYVGRGIVIGKSENEKYAAAGIPVASLISLTSCQELKASRKLMYPGLPERISIGSSEPSCIYILEGF